MNSWHWIHVNLLPLGGVVDLTSQSMWNQCLQRLHSTIGREGLLGSRHEQKMSTETDFRTLLPSLIVRVPLRGKRSIFCFSKHWIRWERISSALNSQSAGSCPNTSSVAKARAYQMNWAAFRHSLCRNRLCQQMASRIDRCQAVWRVGYLGSFHYHISWQCWHRKRHIWCWCQYLL